MIHKAWSKYDRSDISHAPIDFVIKITDLSVEANKRECRIMENLKNRFDIGVFVCFFEYNDQLLFMFVENVE